MSGDGRKPPTRPCDTIGCGNVASHHKVYLDPMLGGDYTCPVCVDTYARRPTDGPARFEPLGVVFSSASS